MDFSQSIPIVRSGWIKIEVYMYKQKVKDMFVGYVTSVYDDDVFHNNCIRQIEQLQNVAPTSMLAITWTTSGHR